MQVTVTLREFLNDSVVNTAMKSLASYCGVKIQELQQQVFVQVPQNLEVEGNVLNLVSIVIGASPRLSCSTKHDVLGELRGRQVMLKRNQPKAQPIYSKRQTAAPGETFLCESGAGCAPDAAWNEEIHGHNVNMPGMRFQVMRSEVEYVLPGIDSVFSDSEASSTPQENPVKRQTNWAHWIAGQAGVIPLSLGIPGVAKTEMHRALALAVGRPFRALMLDQCLPEDLGGFPVVREVEFQEKKHSVMARVHDERFVRCRLEPSILLVDELTNCGHSTQAAALQLMAEGIPGCWIFAAANPIDKAAAGVDLTPPMVNRICVLEWELDREAVLAGWRNGFDFPAPRIPLLPDDWQDYCARWGTLLALFMERKPDLLEAFPHDVSAASQPYPTPRSWTNAGKLLAAAESVDAEPGVQQKLIAGCVGQGACSEFWTWLDQQGLPDPEFLLEHPDRLALPKRGDLAISIVTSVLNRVRNKPSGDRWEALCDLMQVAFTQNQEVTIAALGTVHKIKPSGYIPRIRNGAWSSMNALLLGIDKSAPVVAHAAAR